MRIQNVTRGAVCAVVAALLTTNGAFAQEEAREFYFQQQQRRFPIQPLNAQTLGAAGANLWTRGDALSTVNNPGGLGLMKYGDVNIGYSYNEMSGEEFPTGQDIRGHENIGHVFGATPLGPVKDSLPDYGNLGFGWMGRTGSWSKDTLDTDDDAYSVAIGYGKAVAPDVAVGYSLMYYNDTVNNRVYDYSTSNSFLHTVGAQWQASRDLVAGTTIAFGHGTHELEVFNSNVTDDVDQFNVTLGSGVSYTMDKTTLSGGLDYTYYDNSGDNVVNNQAIVFGGDSEGHSMNLRVGAEQRINDWLALRAGYRYASNFDWEYDRAELDPLSGSAKYNAWSVGAGVNWPLSDTSFIRSVNLDYGAEYRDVGDGDWQQLVSLSTPFDLCR